MKIKATIQEEDLCNEYEKEALIPERRRKTKDRYVTFHGAARRVLGIPLNYTKPDPYSIPDKYIYIQVTPHVGEEFEFEVYEDQIQPYVENYNSRKNQ